MADHSSVRPALRAQAVPVRRRAGLMLAITAVAGLLAFCWPLVIDPGSALAGTTQAPFLFAAILLLLLALVLAELSSEGMDVKALAMLGVLSAVGAVLRVLGAGTAGIQPVFFLLVLAGRVFGPGFGFVLGNTVLFASALLTGGVGPWLPFQMVAAGYVGLLAGLLPQAQGSLGDRDAHGIRARLGLSLRPVDEPVLLAVHRGLRHRPEL